MPDPTSPTVWTICVCPKCGTIEGNDLIQGQSASAATSDDPDGWTEDYYCPNHPGDLPKVEWVEVVPRSQVEKLAEAGEKFIEWFDRRFPANAKGGKNLPGLPLFGIANDFRAALSRYTEEEK